MALTENQKVQMISRLGVAANFTQDYSPNNRIWFIRHMIEHNASTGVADSDIEGRVLNFLQVCKTIVNAKKNFTIGVTFSPALTRSKLSRRIDIIYGTLASKPDLVDSAKSNFLDFIIKRRYRTVMRMDYYVNPNHQGYFRYPKTCKTINRFKVNDDAHLVWDEYEVYRPSERIGNFFKLHSTESALSAIEILFKVFKDPCKGNLLDCARVLSILYQDSLYESIDKDKLIKFLAAKPAFHGAVEPPDGSTAPWISLIEHFSICHPTRDPDNSQFITDTSSEGLFSREGVHIDNLQVGDHIYIYNHPLYKVFNPPGAWSGEHALVYDSGDRDYKSKKGFIFGGHGKEGTLYQFYTAFLQELKTYIDRTYQIAKIHLKFRQSGTILDGLNSIPNITNGTVTVNTSTRGVHMFEYDVPFTYTDYEHGGRPIAERKFLIAHLPGLPFAFWIDKETTIDRLLSNGDAKNPIILERREPPPSGSTPMDQYDPEYYSIKYWKEGDIPGKYDLFQRKGLRIQLRQININDLFTDPFGHIPGTANLVTTRPRVDTSSTYLTFLKTHGAIS
jgi:hypothetical protein